MVAEGLKERLQAAETDRIGDPSRRGPVSIIFNNEELVVGPKVVFAEALDQGSLKFHVMQRVGHENAVELMAGKGVAHKIVGEGQDAGIVRCGLGMDAGAMIDGVNKAAGGKEGGKGKGENAGPGPEVGPGGWGGGGVAGLGECRGEQRDGISRRHAAKLLSCYDERDCCHPGTKNWRPKGCKRIWVDVLAGRRVDIFSRNPRRFC